MFIPFERSGKGAKRRYVAGIFAPTLLTSALGGWLLAVPSRPIAASQPPAPAAITPMSASTAVSLPVLHAICVGAGTFTDPAVQPIPQADADARKVADAIAAQQGRGLYSAVDLKILTGKDATRANIRKALADLSATMRDGDATVLYLCGYSGGDSSARERFLTADLRSRDYESSTLLLSEVRQTVVSLPGHTLIVLDLSHGDPVAALAPPTTPLATATRRREYIPDLGLNSGDLPSSVNLLYGAKAREISVTTPGQAVGAFATALAEAIGEGKAASEPGGAANSADICQYVEARVPELAGGKQHPWNPLLPIDFEDFPVAAPGPHPVLIARDLDRSGAPIVSPMETAAISPGHVPDESDLRPRTREIERSRMVARDVSGQPQTAADWMNQADADVRGENFAQASNAYRQAAALYRQKGHPDDAAVNDARAARYETRLSLFYERPTDGRSTGIRPTLYTAQRLEPYYGAYLGAFIDHEVQVDGELHDEDQSTGRSHRDVAEFNQKIGKRHAAFFTYCGYKSGLPDKWFENLKDNGSAAQWAIEPDSLEEIQDDQHLRDMAKAAADSGIPVFVRFASEMNGGWTPYHTPPALYREKFRLVARVFHELAPNVAMVWCPNEIPESNIADYYPGDDVVDWVGVNFYSVYYNDGDTNKPVAWRNPADKLQYVYSHYASRHPIMICEWAATHHEKADGVDRPEFAAQKIAQLYSSLPRRYPRVKAVFWLDMNAIEYANDPRTRKNDYSLLGQAQVVSAYQRATRSPYFLDRVSRDPLVARSEVAPLSGSGVSTKLSGTVTFSAYVKTYDQAPTVVWSVNGKQAASISEQGAFDWTLDTTGLPNGPAKITATILDSKGRVAEKQTAMVVIDNSGRSAAITPPATVPPVTVTPVAAVPATPKTTAQPTAPTTPVAIVPVPTTTTTSASNAPIAHVVVETRLGPALLHPHVDPNVLKLVLSPADGRVVIGALGAAGGIRVTITPGATLQGDSPTVALILLRRPEGKTDAEAINDGAIQMNYPGEPTDAALTAMAVTPGTPLSIPKSETRYLKPKTPGSFIVRAILFPNKESAKAFLEGITGIGEPTYDFAAEFLHGTVMPAGSGVYVADKNIEVVAGP